jgi:hypothetical protein
LIVETKWAILHSLGISPNYLVTLEGRGDEIPKLAKNTEALIMDAYKVIAVCRNISLPDFLAGNMDEEWPIA